MAGLPRVRRLILLNALIFAVLAAAVALAYYGYAAVDSREREQQLMVELAEEKVFNIESLVVKETTALFSQVHLDDLGRLKDLVKTARVQSVFVLDDKLSLVPDGSVSLGDRAEGLEVRDWLVSELLPQLPLANQPLNTRGHQFIRRGGKPYLFSFTRKLAQDRTFYVVVEEDINRVIYFLFPQFFNFSEYSKRLYQVVDENGRLRFGVPFMDDPDSLAVSVPFVETFDGWELRVAERDLGVRRELARKRVFDSVLIGGAVSVIVAGLAFLALAIRRERRANELKSDFISNVSHELKTPLSIISMFGEMLAKGRTKSPDQASEYAEIIWRESVRLGRLIDNVLDFAKIERGMGVYEFAEADVGEVVERAIDLVSRRLQAADMTIEASIEPDLPPVALDANAFTLAVLNLIDNAIKYATDGKKVEVSLRRAGDRLVLSVRDWGPGIDREEQEHVFERFYRARAMRLKPIRGSGIGLALVRHIARAHRGDVTVTSTPGEGSTFELWLPI
jgi:two-component system, OmpR family, phosphate regulon sensor histidine kinase PhoR